MLWGSLLEEVSAATVFGVPSGLWLGEAQAQKAGNAFTIALRGEW